MKHQPPERAWLHTGRILMYAFPVLVLSSGTKYARVKLLHETRIGRVKYPRGAIKHGVPLYAIGKTPNPSAYVSQGGGRFKPYETP